MRTLLLVWICAALCVVAHAQTEDQCGAEVKLLLVAGQTQSTVTALNAAKKTTGQVYFFDTSSLDLLSHGVIVRLRQGAASDLTVKLRVSAATKVLDAAGRNHRYKCEMDWIGGLAVRSYSIQTKFAGPIPTTGAELFALLSPAQQQLLEQAQASIDWTRVIRIASIKSTDWQIKAQQPFSKLTLELWEWPTGEVLELSAKVGADAAAATYAQLQRFVATKELALATQKSKTALALENITQAATH